jgi:hypothetical protein
MTTLLLAPRSRANPDANGPAIAGADGSLADALLPPAGTGFLLPFLLAALRPSARRWLGAARLKSLAAVLRLKEQAVAHMLDAAPSLPEALRETGTWTGRRVPMLGRGGGIEWIDLHWRPDTQSHGTGPRPPRPDNGSFAIRLRLPGAGLVELRGRLEEHRLDAVAEIELPLRKPVMADMEECFAMALSRLGLAGTLTVRSGRRQFRT